MNVISNIVNPAVVVAVTVVVLIIIKNKLEIVSFLIYLSFFSFIIAIMKSLYGRPRPYWTDEYVKQLEWICY